MKKVLVVAGIAGVIGCHATELKVLTIGNSFADSVFMYLPAIVQSVPDCTIEMGKANLGGCTMERHWREHEQSAKAPNYKPYRFGNRKLSLRTILTEKKWDIVTIQQASHESWRAESYEPYAQNIINLVRELAPQARIVIQQTWSYRIDAPQFKSWKINQNEMYERLTENYKNLAKKYRFGVIPSGLAVQLTRAKTPDDEKFKIYDPAILKTLRWPDLPPQAGDVVGQVAWRKNPEIGELFISTDVIHLNTRGAYLQACLWFAALYGKKTSEIKFVPNVIGARDAEFLQKCAQEALDTFPQVSVD
ncbi:MAG: DUF4886 domain-containing protein [Victivallales bacterium]|jgi:hypothetical protein|nr:DUF4886 domain-containing protein [Victivallales bacterium]